MATSNSKSTSKTTATASKATATDKPLTRAEVEALLGRKLSPVEVKRLKSSPITADMLAPKTKQRRETPLTAEERSAIARKAAASRTPEQRAEAAKKAAATRAAKRKRGKVEELLSV